MLVSLSRVWFTLAGSLVAALTHGLVEKRRTLTKDVEFWSVGLNISGKDSAKLNLEFPS